MGRRRGGVQAGGENGTAIMESNYRFLSFLAGSRGFIGNFFPKVEFRCLLAAMIGRFEFSQDGKREVIVIAGVILKP